MKVWEIRFLKLFIGPFKNVFPSNTFELFCSLIPSTIVVFIAFKRKENLIDSALVIIINSKVVLGGGGHPPSAAKTCSSYGLDQ